MALKTNEASLYLQIAHFARLLDAERPLKAMDTKEARAAERQLAPVSDQLHDAHEYVHGLKDRSAFRWGFNKAFWQRACGFVTPSS